jgi:gluconokinase
VGPVADGDAVLGIDIGTTATKVVAGDHRGRLLGLTEHGYPLRTDHPGEAVQDPDLVLRTVWRAVREGAEQAERAGHRVAGLCLSAAMHTLLALDAEGRPLTPALSWADGRAAGVARRLRAEPETAHALHLATGTPVHPMSPVVKLAWFGEHRPELLRTANRWVALKDYVLRHLTGRLVTDHSSASGSGMLDIHALRWHPPALAVAGVRQDQLPDLVPSTEVLALDRTAAAETGLPAGLPVVAGGGDGPLANLGVGAVLPGTAALSLGTSGALRVVRDRPGVDERGRVFCYALAEGLWVVGGAVSNGGVVAQWAAEAFGVKVRDLLAEAEAVPAGARGVLALPYLLGERAPWWEPDLRAALVGLRREHGRAEIVRALAEGVGQQLALVQDAVRETGAPVDSVRVTGGAFRSPLWATVLAAALGRELEVAEDAEGSGMGAVLLGWWSLGAMSALTDAAGLVTPTRRVRPDEAAVRRLATARPMIERAHDVLRDLVVELSALDDAWD